MLINPLVKLLALRPACVKDSADADFDGKIDPALKRRVDLLVRQGGLLFFSSRPKTISGCIAK